MRPTEFTSEAVIEAGQALQAAGRNVTGFALRQKVGGGNPARIKQLWDEHLAAQSTKIVEPVAELPVEVAEDVAAVTKALTERIGALAVELNDKAVKAAERRVHEIVRSAGEQRSQAERELADAALTVDELETKLDEANGQIDALQGKLDVLLETNQAQAVELAQLGERFTATERAKQEAEDQHIQAVRSVAEQHAAELERINAGIEAERDRHLQEIAQLRAELAEQKLEARTAGAELDQVRTQLTTTKAKAEAAESAHQVRHQTAQREALQAAERLSRAEAGQTTARDEVGAAREDAAKLRGQLEATQLQVVELMRLVGQQAPAEAVTAPPVKTAKKAPSTKKGE